MRSQSSNATSERLLDVFRNSPIPLSTRDVGLRLRQRHVRLPDYKLSGLLRDMLRDGRIGFRKGRWVIPSPIETSNVRSQVTSLPLSSEAISLLDWGSQHPAAAGLKNGMEWTEPEPEPSVDASPYSRWETFRKLVAYYRQCIRNEEGADASAFQNELNKRFVYLRKSGAWYPKPGLRWRASIPLAPHMSPFLKSLPGPSADQALVIGYPIHAYYKVKKNEPDVAIIRPIFFFTVQHSVSRDGLVVSCENSRPEVNLGWLDNTFSRKPDLQRGFLSACGFINRWRPNDEAPGLEKAELAPSLENLIYALSAFMPEKVKQPLELISISDHLLREPFETGIYNRAVLMLARKTKYTATLLKELSAIEKAPDEVLNHTALYHIFTTNEDPHSVDSEEIFHEAIVADTAQLCDWHVRFLDKFNYRLNFQKQRIDRIKNRFKPQAVDFIIKNEKAKLLNKAATLRAADPDTSLKRGFSLVYTEDGGLVKSISQISLADSMRTDVADGRIISVVNKTEGKNDD